MSKLRKDEKDFDKKYVYFITGGGTGGHIYPAVAVADELINDVETDKLFYIGNSKNLEYKIVREKGYDFLSVDVSGMPRKFSVQFLKWSVKLVFAILKSIFYILKYKPDGIFGTGGYVSAPILFANLLLTKLRIKAIPYILHDCDSQPGLVTRKFASNAKSISLAFENACEFINNPNCIINGNPVRKEFKTLSKKDARLKLGLQDKLTLCAMGGSQGARTINQALIKCLKAVTNDLDLQVIFQTGKKNYDEALQLLSSYYPEYSEDKNILLKPYFDDMVTILKSSDIAISRSGSLSISEIYASNIASILIPYPYAAADHQRKNARYVVEKDAGIFIEDSDITPEILLENLKLLINDKKYLASLQQNSFDLAKLNGASDIANQIKEMVKNE
ncbi:MAG: undecaprenyldiphospho-muramoylpentapeptide beta-N-acetylglucosaminyltransferase [Candidatus Gastranaerophilales bacterium]